jgi:hypothetical protein
MRRQTPALCDPSHFIPSGAFGELPSSAETSRRRDDGDQASLLTPGLENVIERFGDRIPAFDRDAALISGLLRVAMPIIPSTGRSLPSRSSATATTRNVADFQALGVS